MFHDWPLIGGVAMGVAVAVAVGITNSIFVVRFKIPSFLVTLGSMFILQGVTLAVAQVLTGSTYIAGVKDEINGDWLAPLFTAAPLGMPIVVWWWGAVTLVCAYVLSWTRFGNWIYATGGNLDSAERAGVPVRRVKAVLFLSTALAASVLATLAMMQVNNASAFEGTGKEFHAAVAAVIGGAAITGGYGSPIGAAVGALLFGMVTQGFFFTNIDNNWFQSFLGIMLLAAVLINGYTRRLGLRQRKVR
jgi:simple sugar transport system permease protein